MYRAQNWYPSSSKSWLKEHFDDIYVRHAVEMLDQRTQAVAVRHEQHAIPATNDRRDAIVPTW